MTQAKGGQFIFGPGKFYAIPNVTVPTPISFGVPQNMEVDFKRDIKRLFGENQLPVDIASGELAVTGKATMGTAQGDIVAQLLMGVTPTPGQEPWISKEAGTSSSLNVITVANSTAFDTDLGVIDVASGVPMTRVASTAPTSLEYYEAAGVYTLSSAGVAAKVSYLYTAAGGQIVNMTNQPMGKTGNFQSVMAWLWSTEKMTIQLNNCMASDFGMQTVLDDYTKPTFGFEAGTDTNDTLGFMSFAEIN